MSTVLEMLDKLWQSIQIYRTKRLADEVIEGEKLKKEVEKDLEEIKNEGV